MGRRLFAQPPVVQPMGNGPLLQETLKALAAFVHHRPQPRDPVFPEGGAVPRLKPEMKQRTSGPRLDFDVTENVGHPRPLAGGDPVESACRPPQSDEPERKPQICRAGRSVRGVPGSSNAQHRHEIGGQRTANPQRPTAGCAAAAGGLPAATSPKRCRTAAISLFIARSGLHAARSRFRGRPIGHPRVILITGAISVFRRLPVSMACASLPWTRTPPEMTERTRDPTLKG